MRFWQGGHAHRTRGGETATGTGKQALGNGGFPLMPKEQTLGLRFGDAKSGTAFFRVLHEDVSLSMNRRGDAFDSASSSVHPTKSSYQRQSR
jgi:hypothetical protein